MSNRQERIKRLKQEVKDMRSDILDKLDAIETAIIASESHEEDTYLASLLVGKVILNNLYTRCIELGMTMPVLTSIVSFTVQDGDSDLIDTIENMDISIANISAMTVPIPRGKN